MGAFSCPHFFLLSSKYLLTKVLVDQIFDDLSYAFLTKSYALAAWSMSLIDS
jgi:hypothetical protein